MMANQSKMMPFPMMMPMGGIGGCPHMWNSGCHHQCNCSCTCNRSCLCQNSCSIPHNSYGASRSYKPVMTESPVQSTMSAKKTEITSRSRNSFITQKSEPRIAPVQVVNLQKTKRKNLLRRFRICAYAVYFSIYLKWFSFQFSLNRYGRFKQKYLADKGVELTNAYKEVYQKMLKIDIPELIRTAAANIPEVNHSSSA
jgi:hypothetical protein